MAVANKNSIFIIKYHEQAFCFNHSQPFIEMCIFKGKFHYYTTITWDFARRWRM